MLGLLTRSHSPFRCRRSALPQRRTRLSFEQLEARDCPAGPVLALSVTPMPGNQVQLIGSANESPPSACPVTFSGVVSGTINTGSDGSFNFITAYSGPGTLSATLVQGSSSSTVSTAISGPGTSTTAPSISISVSFGTGPRVTISGTITDTNVSGQTVSISGVVSGSATTDVNGNYSLTAHASSLGSVTASFTDSSGQSASAKTSIAVPPPQITSFTATQDGDMWTFSGTVSAQSPQGMIVNIYVPGVGNESATVGADGSFSLTVSIPPNTSGTATAQTTDWWGQTSNEADAIVT
jgi:hypothetical protein